MPGRLRRIAAVEPLSAESLTIQAGKRSEPRVPFASLIEAGLIEPGAELTDAGRRHVAHVRADGTVSVAGEAASIHRVGAKVQGLSACNGWTFWHVEDEGQLKPIDELRRLVRERMALRSPAT